MKQRESGVALVLEGGGYRGIFTAGVLDVLMEHGLAGVFASVWGTSAGAMNAINFKSRQLGRTMRIMLAFRDDRRFMSFTSLVRTGNLTGGTSYMTKSKTVSTHATARHSMTTPWPCTQLLQMWCLAQPLTCR